MRQTGQFMMKSESVIHPNPQPFATLTVTDLNTHSHTQSGDSKKKTKNTHTHLGVERNNAVNKEIKSSYLETLRSTVHKRQHDNILNGFF